MVRRGMEGAKPLMFLPAPLRRSEFGSTRIDPTTNGRHKLPERRASPDTIRSKTSAERSMKDLEANTERQECGSSGFGRRLMMLRPWGATCSSAPSHPTHSQSDPIPALAPRPSQPSSGINQPTLIARKNSLWMTPPAPTQEGPSNLLGFGPLA